MSPGEQEQRRYNLSRLQGKLAHLKIRAEYQRGRANEAVLDAETLEQHVLYAQAQIAAMA